MYRNWSKGTIQTGQSEPALLRQNSEAVMQPALSTHSGQREGRSKLQNEAWLVSAGICRGQCG